MTNCNIVPFPMSKRIIVKNLARVLSCYQMEAAERTLESQLEFQRQSLLRKGVATNRVEHEIRSLERAIRAALWNMIMFGGDAA